MFSVDASQFKVRLLVITAFFLFSCGSPPVKGKKNSAYPKAVSTINQGVEWYDKGCYQKAIQLFWEAHEQFSAMDFPQGVAASLNSIGNANRHLGEIDNAILFLNQSLIVYQQLEEPQRQIKVLSDIAAAHLSAENHKAAGGNIQRAEKIARKEHLTSTHLTLTKGIWLSREKKIDQARALLASIAEQIQPYDWTSIGTLNAALGNLELEKGDLASATKHFSLALDADQKSGFYRGIADNLSELGRISARKGNAQQSLFYLQRSIKVYALLGEKKAVASLRPKIETLATSTGQDVGLTLNLVNRWLEGEVHHPLCE